MYNNRAASTWPSEHVAYRRPCRARSFGAAKAPPRMICLGQPSSSARSRPMEAQFSAREALPRAPQRPRLFPATADDGRRGLLLRDGAIIGSTSRHCPATAVPRRHGPSPQAIEQRRRAVLARARSTSAPFPAAAAPRRRGRAMRTTASPTLSPGRPLRPLSSNSRTASTSPFGRCRASTHHHPRLCPKQPPAAAAAASSPFFARSRPTGVAHSLVNRRNPHLHRPIQIGAVVRHNRIARSPVLVEQRRLPTIDLFSRHSAPSPKKSVATSYPIQHAIPCVSHAGDQSPSTAPASSAARATNRRAAKSPAEDERMRPSARSVRVVRCATPPTAPESHEEPSLVALDEKPASIGITRSAAPTSIASPAPLEPRSRATNRPSPPATGASMSLEQAPPARGQVKHRTLTHIRSRGEVRPSPGLVVNAHTSPRVRPMPRRPRPGQNALLSRATSDSRPSRRVREDPSAFTSEPTSITTSGRPYDRVDDAHLLHEFKTTSEPRRARRRVREECQRRTLLSQHRSHEQRLAARDRIEETHLRIVDNHHKRAAARPSPGPQRTPALVTPNRRQSRAAHRQSPRPTRESSYPSTRSRPAARPSPDPQRSPGHSHPQSAPRAPPRSPRRPPPGSRLERLIDPLTSRGSPVAGSVKAVKAHHIVLCVPRARPAPRRPRPGRRRAPSCRLTRSRKPRRAPVARSLNATSASLCPTSSTSSASPPETASKTHAHLPIYLEPHASLGAPVAGSLKTASASTSEPISSTSSA